MKLKLSFVVTKFAMISLLPLDHSFLCYSYPRAEHWGGALSAVTARVGASRAAGACSRSARTELATGPSVWLERGWSTPHFWLWVRVRIRVWVWPRHRVGLRRWERWRCLGGRRPRIGLRRWVRRRGSSGTGTRSGLAGHPAPAPTPTPRNRPPVALLTEARADAQTTRRHWPTRWRARFACWSLELASDSRRVLVARFKSI